MPRLLCFASAAAILLVAIALDGRIHGSFAQIAAPQPIETPIRDEWRSAVTNFARELGAKNPEAITAIAKGFTLMHAATWGGAPINTLGADIVLVRLEDPSLCRKERCLIVIGRIEKDKLIADIMFLAGKWFIVGDVFTPFGPPPLGFFDSEKFDDAQVALLKTAKGWIVSPSSK
jgi:hypothetical protein